MWIGIELFENIDKIQIKSHIYFFPVANIAVFIDIRNQFNVYIFNRFVCFYFFDL